MPELRVGTPVEAELSPGETATYEVPIEAGRYLRIVARPRTMDVALKLLAPDGATLAEANGPGGSKRPEVMPLISSATGIARLEVTRLNAGQRRACLVTLEEQRPARDGDEVRVEAERAYAEAVHRRSLPSGEEMRKALQILEHALPLWQQIGDRKGEIDTLNQIGLSYRWLAQLDEATACFTQSISLAEGAGHRAGLAEAFNGQGLVDKRRGKNGDALANYRRALAIWQELGDAEQEARLLNNIGVLLLDQGDSRDALGYLERALPLWQAVGNLAEEANTLRGVAEIDLWYSGDLGSSNQHLDRAVALCREAEDLQCETSLLVERAGAQRRSGELQRALISYQEALDFFRRLGDPARLAWTQESLGGLYQQLGDLEAARNQFEAALAIYRQQGDRGHEAGVLTSIGVVEQLSGDLHAARAMYQEALALSVEKDRRAEGLAQQRLGVVLCTLEEPAAAIDAFAKALALRQAGGNRSEESRTRLDLASCQSALGKTAAAEENFATALALARQIEDPAIEAVCLLRWAQHDRNAQHLESARARVEEALRIVESTRRQVLSPELQATYFASHHDYYEVYIDLLMRLAEIHPGSGYEMLAFQASERSHARSLLDLLAEGRIDVRKGISPELKRLETQLDLRTQSTQSRLIALLVRAGGAHEEIAKLRQELARLAEERQRVEWEIRTRHPRYAEVRYPSPPALDEVQGLLDESTAFVEYSLGAEASFAFVVTRRGLVGRRLVPLGELSQAVQGLREGLQSPQRRLLGRYLVAARRLHEFLIEPLGAALDGKINLIVAPDGPLHLVSFEALLTREAASGASLRDLPYLLRQYSVTYVPSAGALKSLRAPRERQSSANGLAPGGLRFLAFADPLFRSAKGASIVPGTLRASPSPAESWQPSALPQSRREVTDIASLYPPSEVALFLGSDATEENVKENPRVADARWLHFATHGVINETQPELSGLLLAEDDDPHENGILQTYEIFNLTLGADLVVLSGCETGLGRQVTGEGLVGVMQAFLYAGTPSVLVSLWPVAESSTPRLMLGVYKRLGAGDPKAVALQESKLDMLQTQVWAHPFYWSPFVLVGDGR